MTTINIDYKEERQICGVFSFGGGVFSFGGGFKDHEGREDEAQAGGVEQDAC